MQEIYASPNDIDLFTGGLAQDAYNGGLTGKVFNKMKGITFSLRITRSKGPLRATMFESAGMAELTLLCYFGNSVRWAVSAEIKMVAHNCPLTGSNNLP